MARKTNAKKKHVSSTELQRLQEARYKNFFFGKLMELCVRIEDASLYSTIPPIGRLSAYFFRSAPLRVMIAPGSKIPRQLMEALEKTIKSEQLLKKVKIVEDSPEEMTLSDYALVGMALENMLALTELTFPGKERFADFFKLRMERLHLYERGIHEICMAVCWFFDDLDRRHLHTYSYESRTLFDEYKKLGPGANILEQDHRVHPEVTIGTYPLEVRKIKIDGEMHTGIQTGRAVCVTGTPVFMPYTVLTSDLPLKSNLTSVELPVYIQQHALDRVKERLGRIMPCFYMGMLADAIGRKEFVLAGKERLLMTCYLEGLKVGYFAASIVDGILLIRTFLLLTHGGTPEGNRLTALSGMVARDQKFFAIDTLPGLINSDIEQNEAVCSMFIAAGCGSILELCRHANTDPATKLRFSAQPRNIVGDLIATYVKTYDDREYYVQEE